jgi:Fe-S-cluster containining protein
VYCYQGRASYVDEFGKLRIAGACLVSVAGRRRVSQCQRESAGGPTTLTQLLPIIQNLENAIVGRICEEAELAGTPISCRAGCGACCRQLVPVSFFEAEALTEWMSTLPEQRRVELEGRFHRALLALLGAGVIEKILDDRWTLKEGTATQLAIDYFHAGVPCPFLENESCSIHPIRPLSCREYLVTSPPDLCQDPSVNQVAGVQLPLKLSRVLYAFGQRLAQDRRGWIPLVFLLAWRKGGQRPGDYVAGTGEEVLRKFLEQVTKMPPMENGQPVEAPAGQ